MTSRSMLIWMQNEVGCGQKEKKESEILTLLRATKVIWRDCHKIYLHNICTQILPLCICVCFVFLTRKQTAARS